MEDQAHEGMAPGGRRPDLIRRWMGPAMVLFLLLAVVAGGFLAVQRYVGQPGPLPPGEARIVEIPPGTGLRAIRGLLAREGIVRDDARFEASAILLGVRSRLKAGEYLFRGPISPRELFRDLSEGRVHLRRLTVPEGATIRDVAGLLQAQGWGGESVEDFARDPLLVASELGFAASSLEGYLFPDTYLFPKRTPAEKIVRAMTARFRQVFSEVCKDTETQGIRFDCRLGGKAEGAAGTHATPIVVPAHGIVILASIVERESAQAEERPLVARVFLNRLRLGMKLQADPTVLYGLGDPDRALTRDDLERPTPYNTYVHPGLPAGPIGNPGRLALQAVFDAPPGDWLYFVLQGDGRHSFSTTLAEHNRAVGRYRQAQREEKNREAVSN